MVEEDTMKPMLPIENYFGKLELVYEFYGTMPTGVSVSETGRIFICFPKWGDDVKFTVAEIVEDKLQPYPNLQTNLVNPENITMTFISVQSVVADGRGTLWILDTAAPNFSEPIKGGAKLVAVDLITNTIRRVYTFTEDVVLPTTYLNDVRFDFRVGNAGYAYITDSSSKGPGAIIVVDLENGNAFRRLNGANSTSPSLFLPKVEGKILMNRNKDGSTSPFRLASDSLAISPDGKILFFAALTSRHLFSISTEALRDRNIPNMDLPYHVEYWGEKGASDGMITDAKGAVYAEIMRTIVFERYCRMAQWKPSHMIREFYGRILFDWSGSILIFHCESITSAGKISLWQRPTTKTV